MIYFSDKHKYYSILQNYICLIMAMGGSNLLKGYFNIAKKTIHCSKRLKSLSILENFSGVEPVSMSFNIYDKRINNENPEPLLIMHGLFGSKSNWNSLSKAINDITKRKVITVDARNHGASPHSKKFSYYHLVEDINFLVQSLNIPKVYLMGHSMGGRAAMLYSLFYPDSLEKLIIVDISPISSSTQMSGMKKYFDAMRSVNLTASETLSEARKKADVTLSSYVPELEVRQFLLTNLIQHNGKFHWRINLDVLENAFNDLIMQFPAINKRFEKPVLFIGGSKSDYLKKEDHINILQMFPKARFEYLDAGHWVHAEKPNDFIKLIAGFLKE